MLEIDTFSCNKEMIIRKRRSEKNIVENLNAALINNCGKFHLGVKFCFC